MYSNGVVGPVKDFTLAYQTNSQLHNSLQIFIQANSDKSYRPKPMVDFDKMYSYAYKWFTMGHVPIKKANHKKMASAFVNSYKGAPDWLIEELKEKDDGKNTS